MSKKFNFNTYFKEAKKKEADLPYTKRLEVQHKDAPNAITDKQLAKKDHAGKAPNVTTEKQLKPVRVEDEGLSIEGRLNKNKARFDIKHRNKEAYTGNINKVEAKRISKDKMEDEEYTAASVVPKGMRWWEKEAKIASLKAELKKLSATDEKEVALDDYLNDESRGWANVSEMGDTPETGVIDRDPENEFVGKPEMNIDDEGDEDEVGSRNLYVADKQEKEIAGIYTLMLKVSYDPTGWAGDMDSLKEEALEKVISTRPDLEGKVSIDDIGDRPSRTKDGQPCLVFRVVGDEYKSNMAPTSTPFKELSYKQEDMDGTPMAKGVVKINNIANFMDTNTQDINSDEIAQAVADFVNEKHPELGIDADSVVVDLDRKVATFMVDTFGADSSNPTEFPVNEEPASSMPDASPDFPITQDPVDDFGNFDKFK